MVYIQYFRISRTISSLYTIYIYRYPASFLILMTEYDEWCTIRVCVCCRENNVSKREYILCIYISTRNNGLLLQIEQLAQEIYSESWWQEREKLAILSASNEQKNVREERAYMYRSIVYLYVYYTFTGENCEPIYVYYALIAVYCTYRYTTYTRDTILNCIMHSILDFLNTVLWWSNIHGFATLNLTVTIC